MTDTIELMTQQQIYKQIIRRVNTRKNKRRLRTWRVFVAQMLTDMDELVMIMKRIHAADIELTYV